MTTNTNAALPDAVRVPLDSLHADAEYLCARLLDKSLTREEVVTAIRFRIDAAKAALTTAAAVPAPVVGEKFQRAWIQLDQLPGGMMVSSDIGLFGPVPASTSAWITTSERERDRCLSAGKPMLEVWLAAAPKAEPVPAGEYPPLPASYVGGTLLSAEPGITGCKVVLRFSNTDEAEVWFGALATRRAAAAIGEQMP